MDLGRGALVERLERSAPLAREGDDLPASVVVRPLARDEPVVLEPGENPAHVPGVDVERAAKLGDLGRFALRELEDDAALGKRVRRVEQSFAQHADHVRVEAAELANGVDCHALLRSLTWSKIPRI